MRRPIRISIDVGGTFTDIVLFDERDQRLIYTKTLTTPKNLARGVLTGLEKVLRLANNSIKDVACIIHGTTIGTNALIQRRGARTGLITTEGFIDVLEIGRVQRPKEGLYDFYAENPAPLVPRYLRKGVPERIDCRGNVVMKLDDKTCCEVLRYFKKQKVKSIAVSFLFSFLNDRHEKLVAKLAKRIHPTAYVSLSSEIAPEFREFERTSTTVINAYLQPLLTEYIETLSQKLSKKYGVELRIMQAGGGVMSTEAAKKHAVNIVNSGPAGGAVAGAFIGRMTKSRNVISVDMGGTSFDICLIENGAPRFTTEGNFECYPVKIPIIDISGIGAGGGSIAWLDSGGVLNVGPQSAGSDPGPACYGFGGTQPTVTDANLLLGRLNPDYFLGGEMKLDVERAATAIRTYIAEKLGMNVTEAANAIIRIVNANMGKGISVASTQKGYDVREFSLVAFGGAGPLHAVEIARELGIPKVIIPPMPGNFSAFGLLVADTKHDYVRSFLRAADTLRAAEARKIFMSMEKKARAQLHAEKIEPNKMSILWSADMRYVGQSYELNIPIDRNIRFGKSDVEAAINRFVMRHREIYEYGSKDEKIEFVNLRVTAIGRSPAIKLPRLKPGTSNPYDALKGTRKVFFEETGFTECRIYDRTRLKHNNVLKGPCLIEEPMSVTVIIPGTEGVVDRFGNIVVE